MYKFLITTEKTRKYSNNNLSDNIICNTYAYKLSLKIFFKEIRNAATVFNLTNVQEIYLLYIAAELKKGGYAEIQQNDCPLLID